MYATRAPASGFTLIELLMALAVAATLAALGAPSLASLLARTTSRSYRSTIANTLRHARTAAIMHNARVIVCPSADNRHCEHTTEWQHGWLVASDADHDGQPDPGQPVLATTPAAPTGTGITTSAGRTHLVFHPNGNAAGSNVRFTVCHRGAATAQSVVLSNAGRVRVEPAPTGSLQQCLAAAG